MYITWLLINHSVDLTFVDFVVLQDNIQLTLFLLFNVKGSLMNRYLLRVSSVCDLVSRGETDINQLQIMKHTL